MHLLAANRQVGETALNDKSSRSHQIIRLVSVHCISTILYCGTCIYENDSWVFIKIIIFSFYNMFELNALSFIFLSDTTCFIHWLLSQLYTCFCLLFNVAHFCNFLSDCLLDSRLLSNLSHWMMCFISFCMFSFSLVWVTDIFLLLFSSYKLIN